MFFQHTIIFLVLLTFIIFVNGECITPTLYPKNGFCRTIIGDRPFYLNTPAVLSNTATASLLLKQKENQIARQWLSAKERQALGSDCAAKYSAYLCELAYPRCSDSSTGHLAEYRCRQTCTDLASDTECRNKLFSLQRPSEQRQLVSFPKDATCVAPRDGIEYKQCPELVILKARASQDNVVMATAAASNWNLTGRMVDTFVCPSPLIQDPLWPGKSQSPQCVNGCCIPCPVTNAFYPPNTLEIGFRVASLLRGISTLLVLFLFASYLVLPGKRKYPTSLIFFSTISIVIFSLSAFFVITDPKTIQCADAITQSTMNNNPLCGIQGAILIFGSFSACFWVAIIILNLHLHTVWNNQWMSRYYKWVVIVGWSYSAIGTAVPLALNVVQYDFAELCLVSKDHAGVFFWPLGAIVFPAGFLHLWTFVHIIRVRRRAHGHTVPGSNPSSNGAVRRAQKIAAMETLRLQWRAVLLSLSLMCSLVFYWVFYFTEINRTSHTHRQELIPLWFKCIAAGNGQAYCASIMDEVLPSFQIMIAAEVLVSMQGIVFFLIFGLQRRLYLEWRMLFTRRAARRSAIKLVNRRQSQSPKAIQRDLDYKSTNSWGRSISGVLLSPTKLRDSIPNMEMSDVPDSYPDSNRLTEISVLSDYVYAEEYIDDRPQLEPPSNMLDMPAGSTATSSTLSNGERSLQAPSDIAYPTPSLQPPRLMDEQDNYSPTRNVFEANTNHIHLIPRQPSDIYNNNNDNNNNYNNYNNYNHYNYNYNYSNNDSDDIENRSESMEDGRYESTRMNRSFSASSRGPMFVGLARAVSQQFNESDGNQQRVRTPPNAYPMP